MGPLDKALHSRRCEFLKIQAANAIKNVLSRPRFGIDVTEFSGFVSVPPGVPARLKAEKDGFHYDVKVSVFSNRVLINVSTKDYDPGELFYYTSFKTDEMKNFRKIGLTIANKIKMRSFHFVSTS